MRNDLYPCSKKEISDALSDFGITIGDDEKTDPLLMQKILHEINFDFNIFDSCELLKRLISEEIPLKPIKEAILTGIKSNWPLCKTLIETKGMSSYNEDSAKNKPERSVQLTYSIYFIVILQILTHLIVNDKEIENKIIYSILKKESGKKIGSAFLVFLRKIFQTKGSFIEAIKYISVTPLMFESICCRKYPPMPSENEINEFIHENYLKGFYANAVKKKLNHLSKKNKNYSVLHANILEALRDEENLVNKINSFHFGTKNSKKSVDNVKAGLALILYLDKYKNDFPAVEFKEENFTLNYRFQPNTLGSDSTFWDDLYHYTKKNNRVKVCKIISQEWLDLYEGWNIAFILRRFPKQFHLFLPKLLIPDTLLSVPEFYFSSRPISLWLAMSFVWALRSNKVKVECETSNLEPFLTVFGKNNLFYAKNVLLKTSMDLDELYEERIQNRSTIANYLEAIKLINF